jgi:hypothetical protein
MNKNMLSPLGFSFNIKKLPEFNFFVQSVTLPGINLPFTEQPTPFKKIPIYGDHIDYGEMQVSFKINEDLGNYIEIFNWIRDLGFPNEYPEYARIAEPNKQLTGDGIYSDAYLMILSSNQQPIIRIDIIDLFPTALSDITMDSRDTAIDYIEATVSFKFVNYTFTPQ